MQLRSQGAKLVRWYGGPRGSQQAFLARVSEGRYVCAFRGTSCVLDLLDVCDTRAASAVRGARAHKGFVERFRALEPRLSSDLWHAARMEPAGLAEVCFTGHSMGGGVAAIAAAHYGARWRDGERGPRVVCHAFGTPACCESAMLDGCEHVGVILREDAVAALGVNPAFRFLPNTLEVGLGGEAGCLIPARRAIDLRHALGTVARHGAGTHGCAEYQRALAQMAKLSERGAALFDLFPARGRG